MFGKLIAFVGMDGAGKTTLVKLLKNKLNSENYKVKVLYLGRGKSNILPISFFGKVYKKSGGKFSHETSNTKKFKKNSLIYSLSAPIFAFDLFLRYFFTIIPNLRKNDYVITDRYSTDLLLMNKVPFWLKKTLYNFIPKPNKIIYIFNDIKVLNSRKPEHPIKDLERQEKIFKIILPKIKAHKIKNDNLNQSVQEILSIIK